MRCCVHDTLNVASVVPNNMSGTLYVNKYLLNKQLHTFDTFKFKHKSTYIKCSEFEKISNLCENDKKSISIQDHHYSSPTDLGLNPNSTT